MFQNDISVLCNSNTVLYEVDFAAWFRKAVMSCAAHAVVSGN